MPRFATTWLPVVAWATLIFVLSSIPSLNSGLGIVDLILRKIAHFVEFAVLGALLARVLPELPAFLAGVAYAATDELHQALVPGRQAAVSDFVIDAAGVAAGIVALEAARRRVRTETVQSPR